MNRRNNRHFAFHDAEGKVKCVISKSYGEPAEREGYICTEVPSREHLIHLEGGEFVPYLPDQSGRAARRDRNAKRAEREARRRAAIQRATERFMRANDPELDAELREIERDDESTGRASQE